MIVPIVLILGVLTALVTNYYYFGSQAATQTQVKSTSQNGKFAKPEGYLHR